MTRRHGRPLNFEAMEGRSLPAGAGPATSAIVSLIEFDSAVARTVPENVGQVSFAVKRTGDLSAAASVQVRTVAGTALEGYDYAAKAITLAFAPGESIKTFTVSIVDDLQAEALYKSFRLVLSSPSAGAGLGMISNRTVTIMDDEPASRVPLSFIDFGPSGLWTYDDVQGFRKIHDGDAQAVVASSNRMAYVDFGAAGMWSWDSLRGFRRLTDLDPQSILVVNNDWTHAEDVVLADLGAAGLWRWSDSRGWARLSDVDPRAMIVDRQDVYIDFGYGGLWRYRDDLAAPWYKLNDAVPESMVADGTLFLDYGPSGLWSWTGAQGWRKVGEGDPKAIASIGSTLYTDYDGAGVWSWNDASGWTQVIAADPRTMKTAGGKLFLDFGIYGLWSTTPGAGFTRLADADVQGFTPSQGGDRVLVDQGAAGIWVWTRDGYRKLNGANPDAIAVTA